MVMYSELLNYGGGIETWFDYFIRGLIEEGNYKRIFIYHIKPRVFERSLVYKFNDVKCLHFIEVDLGKPEQNNAVKNHLLFSLSVIKKLKKNYYDNDIVLLIGSIAGSVFLKMLDLFFKRSVKNVVTWVRSKSIGELSSTGSSSIYVRTAKYLEKNLFYRSKRIITNGMDTLKYYQGLYPEFSCKTFSNPNAINYNKFAEIIPPSFGRKSKIKIAYMGRMVKAKGYYEFLDSIQHFNKITNNDNDVIFNIYGHGTKDRIYDKNVNYFGEYSQKEINSILSNNDAVVFLNFENLAGGLSHSLLEAMASGRVIIAWDNFVHKQVLDMDNSYLVKEGDVEKLANLFKALQHKDPLEVLNKCEKAREKSKGYSIEYHIKNFINIVED